MSGLSANAWKRTLSTALQMHVNSVAERWCEVRVYPQEIRGDKYHMVFAAFNKWKLSRASKVFCPCWTLILRYSPDYWAGTEDAVFSKIDTLTDKVDEWIKSLRKDAKESSTQEVDLDA